MKYLYRIYQLFVGLPVLVLMTIITAIEIGIGTTIGDGHYWGYYPGRWWGRVILRSLFIPVTVEGCENLERDQSYVFVANHQGAFDIFLIYGYLKRNFKWMMKYQLKKIPFFGYACVRSHQIFVDKRGPSKVRKTYEQAREILKEGYSVTVFPEGARTFTGHMAQFRKGAFALADELQLPVVPLTINGSFDIMPRTSRWAAWHPMKLTIHEPIETSKAGRDVKQVMDESYRAIEQALVPQYQGFIENPDQ